MEIIDNINRILKDDLKVEIRSESKLSIAAACFSIYAFQELKKELKNIKKNDLGIIWLDNKVILFTCFRIS